MMKVFVWKRIQDCTGSYHSEGGVVVFAETEERARELFAQSLSKWERERGCKIAADELPDDVREVSGGEEAVYVMPDAGCC